jgi:hypothetical protein
MFIPERVVYRLRHLKEIAKLRHEAALIESQIRELDLSLMMIKTKSRDLIIELEQQESHIHKWTKGDEHYGTTEDRPEGTDEDEESNERIQARRTHKPRQGGY